MVAATLIYHAEEHIAFWLLVALLNKLKLREVFEPEMPGFHKHTQIVHMLIFNKLR